MSSQASNDFNAGLSLRKGALLAAAVTALALGGCASSTELTQTDLPAPTTESLTKALDAEYRIGPMDQLGINVFRVPELTIDAIQVDSAGMLDLPLIGQLEAGGRTTQELSQDIAARLKDKYLRDPQVTVQIKEANGQKVTVEGAVEQPGVYDMSGQATLLQAIALARGPAKVADIHRVAVFRNIDGKRAAAVFDLGAIRSGATPDPRLYGNDIVVVQGSAGKGIWQEVLRAVPAIGLFRYF